MKRIIFFGPQCSGKTTRALLTYYVLKQLGYRVVYRGEFVDECPLPINEQGSYASQKWILLQYMVKDSNPPVCDYYIMDRSVLDTIPYVIALCNAKQLTLEQAIELVLQAFIVYQRLSGEKILFYNEPLPLIDDGVRSESTEFQNTIAEHFEWVITQLGLEVTRIQEHMPEPLAVAQRAEYDHYIFDEKPSLEPEIVSNQLVDAEWQHDGKSFVLGMVGYPDVDTETINYILLGIKDLPVKLKIDNWKERVNVAYAQLPKLFNSIDCYVSGKDVDVPLMMLTAMSYSMPIIAFRTKLTTEIFTDDVNGIVLPPFPTVSDFEDAVEYLRNDAGKRTSLGSEARKTAVEKWTLNKIVKSYTELVNEIQEINGVERQNPRIAILLDYRQSLLDLAFTELRKVMPANYDLTNFYVTEDSINPDDISWNRYDTVFNYMWATINHQNDLTMIPKHTIYCITREPSNIEWVALQQLMTESHVVASSKYLVDLVAEHLGKEPRLCTFGVDVELYNSG